MALLGYRKTNDEGLFIRNLLKGLTRADVKGKWAVLELDWVKEESR